MDVTLRYGVTSVDTQVSEGTTVSAIAGSSRWQATLNLPESYRAVVNGSPVESSYVIQDGDEVVFETRANTKG